MHGGVLWPGIPNARGGCWDWNSKCMRGFLVLEFRRGLGAKNSDLLTSEVRKTSLVRVLAQQTEPQSMTMKLGCTAYLNTCFRQLFQWSFR